MSACIGAASADTLRKADGPAEFPPASFKGKQYVDSKGCVFIRAGVDGAVTWVPRVARNRQVICGFKPSLAAQAGAAPAPAPSSPKSPSAVTITAAVPESKSPPAQSAAPVRRSKPKVVRRTPVKPANDIYIPPATVAVAAPKVIPATRRQGMAPRVVGQAGGCGASPVSARYLNTSKHKVRCGPQAERPYTPGRGNPTAQAPMGQVRYAPGQYGASYQSGARNVVVARTADASARRVVVPVQVVQPGQVPAGTRVVRRHVYEDRVLALTETPVPHGYRKVWSDDRLNPHRSDGTFAGEAGMRMVWTNTVPRELVPVESVASPYRHVAAAPQVIQPAQGYGHKYQKMAPQPVVATISTKSTPAQQPLKRDTIRASVQVATYSDAGAAQRAARQIQRMGLPARIGRVNRNGQSLRIVVAGPFSSQAKLNAALGKVHRSGYRSAFIRN